MVLVSTVEGLFRTLNVDNDDGCGFGCRRFVENEDIGIDLS